MGLEEEAEAFHPGTAPGQPTLPLATLEEIFPSVALSEAVASSGTQSFPVWAQNSLSGWRNHRADVLTSVGRRMEGGKPWQGRSVRYSSQEGGFHSNEPFVF